MGCLEPDPAIDLIVHHLGAKENRHWLEASAIGIDILSEQVTFYIPSCQIALHPQYHREAVNAFVR
jgi:hypothetical protein